MKIKKIQQTFLRPLIEFRLFKKKVISSEYAVYKQFCLKFVKLSILSFAVFFSNNTFSEAQFF